MHSLDLMRKTNEVILVWSILSWITIRTSNGLAMDNAYLCNNQYDAHFAYLYA